MKIIDYHFGSLSIEENTFDKDVIISGTKIFPDWWRKEGHKLHWLDLAARVSEIRPEIVIIGRGKFGRLDVLPEVIEKLNDLNISLFAYKTSKAVLEFNNLIKNNNVLGAFHLTC